MEYLIRLISSDDHSKSIDEVMRIIQKTGTDKYDKTVAPIFDDFYGKHDFDFFAQRPVPAEALEAEIKDAVAKFPKRTLGDRGRSVKPDLVIIYDASKCKMLDKVYDWSGSDCFKFKGEPIDALVEVRKI